jgi:hypothetical protein
MIHYIDMSYAAREELFDMSTSFDDLSENEAQAMTVPPPGSEGNSVSNAGRADETAFEEMIRKYILRPLL